MLTERPWTQGPHTVDVMGADQAHGDRSSMADQGETRPKCTGRDAEIDSQCGTNNAAGRLVSSVVRVGGGECGTRMQRIKKPALEENCKEGNKTGGCLLAAACWVSI